jgi:erlin
LNEFGFLGRGEKMLVKFAASVVLAIWFLASFGSACIATIETGFVGVKVVWNQVTPELLTPGGPYFYNCLSTRIELVEIRPQTDAVFDVSCGTSDGVKILLPKIEIGNQLSKEHVYEILSRFGAYYDKYLVTDLVIHQINVICSKMSAHEIAISKFEEIDDLLIQFLRDENERQSTGLVINFVRPSRPTLPPSLDKNYLAIAEEKTLKKILLEKTERLKTEKDSELMVSQRDNEIKLTVIENDNRVMIAKMEAKQKEQKIQNEMNIEAARANLEKAQMEAQALREIFSIPGYKEVEVARSLSQNQKIYYGDKLPVNFPLLTQMQEGTTTS